jgi:hypothetical protein
MRAIGLLLGLLLAISASGQTPTPRPCADAQFSGASCYPGARVGIKIGAETKSLQGAITDGDLGETTLATGSAVVASSCTNLGISPCYQTIQAAVTAVEAADADGSRFVYVYPKTATFGNVNEAYLEDVSCIPAAGHTEIVGMGGAFGHNSSLVRVTGSDVGALVPTFTLSRCGIKNLMVQSGESGESSVVTSSGGIESVNIDNCSILGTGVYFLIEANQKIVRILSSDGHVEIHDTVIGGICFGTNSESAGLYIDEGAGGGTNPKFHMEGGMIGIEGVHGSSCAAHAAAIELVDTFPETSFHRVSLGCEGASSCIEWNDNEVFATLIGLTLNEPIVDTELGRLMSIRDVDADNNGLCDSKLYIDGIAGLHNGWFTLPIDYDESCLAGTSLFGSLNWSGATAGAPGAGTGAGVCWPGWTFSDLIPDGTPITSLYSCDGTGGGPGTWTVR